MQTLAEFYCMPRARKKRRAKRKYRLETRVKRKVRKGIKSTRRGVGKRLVRFGKRLSR